MQTRLLFLTRDQPAGRFLAARLAEAGFALTVVVEDSGSNTLRKALRQIKNRAKKSLPSAIATFFALPVQAMISRRLATSIAEKLQAPSGFPEGAKVCRVGNINSGESLNCLRREDEHDVCLCYGTSILREQTLSLLNRPLNCHMGWVPEYRGARSEFWAVYRDEPDMAGFSVHELSPKLDAGRLIFRQKTEISLRENEADWRSENLRALAGVLPDILTRHANDETEAVAQNENNKAYYSTPGLLHQFSLWRRLRVKNR